MKPKHRTRSASSRSKSNKLAEDVCYALIIIFNLSTWIDINSVFIELPLMVNKTPERWTLPSTLSLFICLANVFPLFVAVFRWKMPNRYSEIPFIYIIIIVGIVSCCAIGFFWNHTTNIDGKEHSLALISAVSALAILDCTSSLVFYDYMRHLKAKYLHAMFFGESLTGTIPTLIALAQGVGGEALCIHDNITSTPVAIYSETRFSVSTFFFLVSGIITTSLIAFMILQCTPIVEAANAIDRPAIDMNTEAHDMILATTETIPEENESSLSTPNAMTPKQFYILQFFNFLDSAILYGCLPTLITYSLLPYGQKAFYYCSIMCPMSYPLSAFYGFIRPIISSFWIIVGSIIGCLICLFIVITAIQSPCPIWADTLQGGIVMTTAWFLSSLILSYVRIASGNSIKLLWPKESGLFNYGLSVQSGMILGVVPMYLIINVFELLEDRKPCVHYCS